MPRGLDLNNPMNLMTTPNFTWHGQIHPTADPQGRLAQFDTAYNGIRAGAKNLMNQQVLHGLNTWVSIITKYAPPFENDTGAYILAMCRATGVDPQDTLDLTDPDLLETACRCVIIHEQGNCPFTDDQIAAAVAEVVPPKPGVTS